MSVARFYLPSLTAGADEIDLPDHEARHLGRVLRLKAGATVRVFDGQGREHEAVVRVVEPRRVSVRVGHQVEPVPEPVVAVTLALACLTGRKLDTVVRDATMLGVTRIVPLLTTRSGASAAPSPRLVERWEQIAIASAKQCGRAVVPSVDMPMAFADFLSRGSAGDPRVLLVEPGVRGDGLDVVAPTVLAAADVPTHIDLAVGPEGGWTTDEVASAATAGFMLLALGARTLRADAAPTVALAVLRHLWSDL